MWGGWCGYLHGRDCVGTWTAALKAAGANNRASPHRLSGQREAFLRFLTLGAAGTSGLVSRRHLGPILPTDNSLSAPPNQNEPSVIHSTKTKKG